MSGSGLPYRLRPNKYVDRELFAELVSVAVAREGADKYAYLSMGGRHLSDHLAVLRRAGLTKFVSFDIDPNVVARQRFNAVLPTSICETLHSGELPSKIQDFLERLGSDRAIVWLDYTEPKRRAQLKEVDALAAVLQPGDMLRVTLNAEFATLERKREAQLTPAQKELPMERKRAVILKKELNDYVPGSIEQISNDDIGVALARCVGRACEMGIRNSGANRVAVPILLTDYTDTTRMVTVTVLFANEADDDIFGLRGWVHTARDWSNVERLTIPDFSPRERHALDMVERNEGATLNDTLGFDFDPADVATYRRFRRFFPLFQSVSD
ncbi:O-methyltransferase [Aurantimonas marina]|uniref:O-methyltransferase n=1 Tax=Aurantimonas marina TaxID=2780508 RepID=UPI0019D038B4|nr:O-methyltransferase [Aurantimonas marina]